VPSDVQRLLSEELAAKFEHIEHEEDGWVLRGDLCRTSPGDGEALLQSAEVCPPVFIRK
jgi:hypothetical protein